MQISQSADTIIWFQKDTGWIAGCLCHFDLSVTIDSLSNGHYFTKVFYQDLELDTTCYVGMIEFDITKQRTFISNKTIDQHQSLCFNFGVGVSTKRPKQRITIYPSPASEFVNILTEDNSLKEVQIIDINNKQILKIQSNKSLNIINVNNLPKGIYFIRIFNDKNIVVAKFCKN